ncbi:MAG: Aerotolerance protein BatC [Bacteroidota bacterium]|jgi:tetratricopeptide (TPR) repeat protein
MKVILFFILLVFGLNNGAFSQTLRQESVENTFKGITLIEKEQPNEAERAFRTASALDSLNAISDYNLGNTLFKQGAEEESFGHYKAASTKTNDESLSHQAFHNIGNVYMKRKEYQNAVQAYKEALKRNPNDDETRYNYALAKKMLEEEQKNQNQDQEQDQNQEQDQQKDQEQDQQKDQGEGGDQENQGDSDPKEDNSDDSGENQKEKEEQKKGDGNQKEERGRKPENQPQQNDPKPQELSKQQIEALLQALQNEENKVQEKMNAQKVQGQKLKVEKDW